MWKQILYLSWLVAAGCSDIADREYPEPQPAPAATTDSQATVQTRNLLGNLRSIAENGGTLFGHQCSSLYGIGWSGDVDRSDVKSICGDYPAMMGWDLAQIELWDLDPNSPTGVDNDAKNIDGDKFTDIRNRILEAYARGGVTTIGWHTTNPATGGFWWGKGNCTAEEYIALWRFTLEYLRDTKGVHNLLYVYSPDIVSSQDNYLEFWPGDAYVDILGLDAYDRSSWAIETNGLRLMRLLKHIAYLKNKPFAFTETGLENNTSQSKWWTEKLSKAIAGVPVAYVLVWRNKDTNHFFGPYPGCVSEEDFKTFVAGEQILLEKDIAGIYE